MGQSLEPTVYYPLLESSRTMTFQGWYLVQGHPSREVFRVQSHGASEESDFHQVTKPQFIIFVYVCVICMMLDSRVLGSVFPLLGNI